ncbi:hypothetical protein V3J41_004110 [Salmonella enterica]
MLIPRYYILLVYLLPDKPLKMVCRHFQSLECHHLAAVLLRLSAVLRAVAPALPVPAVHVCRPVWLFWR